MACITYGGDTLADAKKQNFLHGAVILTAGLVIIKVLGAIYKIPIANILGKEGYAVFLAAYNVYSVFYTVSTAGVPVALSRLVADADVSGRPMQIRRYYRTAVVTFFCIGLICSGVMYLFPVELADYIGQETASQSIWALSPAILMCCMVAVYRGFMQGHSNMIPTTISQVLEVLVKLIVGLALVMMFTNMGKSRPLCCAAAISGVTAGTLVALVYLIIYKLRNYGNRPLSAEETDVPDSYGKTFSTLMLVVIPISIGASVQAITNFIDTKQVNEILKTVLCYDKELADGLYGIYGEAQTLYNLPATIISALSVSIVPAIAAQIALKNRLAAHTMAETALRITAVLALPMAVGLFTLSDPIMNVIYWGEVGSAGEGGRLLMILSVGSFFLCMTTVLTGIMQAGGQERLSMGFAVLGSLVKILANRVLIANPAINIYGAPLGTLACYGTICILDFLFLKKCLGAYPSLRKIFVRPLVSTAVMGVSAFGVYQMCRLILGAAPGRMLMAVYLAVSIGAAVVVYLVMVIMTRSITAEDMKLIPKGEKLAKFLKMG